MTLLTGDFLAVRSLLVLTRADPRLPPRAGADPPSPSSGGARKTPEQTRAFNRELLARLRALPNVRTAAWYATRALLGIVYTVEGGAWPFVVVVLTLLGAAVVAGTAPALRAASADPAQALRRE